MEEGDPGRVFLYLTRTHLIVLGDDQPGVISFSHLKKIVDFSFEHNSGDYPSHSDHNPDEGDKFFMYCY